MEARITINGQEILTDEKFAAARVALRNVAATENMTAKTPVDAVAKFPNAQAVADKLLSLAGDSPETATIVFYEKPEGKTVESVASQGTVEHFVNRLLVAANADNYRMEITKKESKKESGDKTQQSFEL